MQIHAAEKSICRIRVIHGYNGGTRIRSMLREEYGYGREPAVKRIEMGDNQGITELVLREFSEYGDCKKRGGMVDYYCGTWYITCAVCRRNSIVSTA